MVDLGQGNEASGPNVNDPEEDCDAKFSAASADENEPSSKDSGMQLVVPTWLAGEYKKLHDEMMKSKNGLPLCYGGRQQQFIQGIDGIVLVNDLSYMVSLTSPP